MILVNRSEFFARADEHYLDALDARSLTSQTNRALDQLCTPDESAADAVSAGHRVLLATNDEW